MAKKKNNERKLEDLPIRVNFLPGGDLTGDRWESLERDLNTIVNASIPNKRPFWSVYVEIDDYSICYWARQLGGTYVDGTTLDKYYSFEHKLTKRGRHDLDISIEMPDGQVPVEIEAYHLTCDLFDKIRREKVR